MTRQVFIGLYTEGPTDIRFLKSVVRKTFHEIAFEAPGDFEFFIEPIFICKTGLDFNTQILQASITGFKDMGISIFCIHKDADDSDDNNVFRNSINPALQCLLESDEELCRTVVLAIPVQMIEAWLLADKELFKKALGTDKSDIELGINKNPETFSDPKQIIENAIRIARQNRPQRRRHDFSISEIYMPLGDEIGIDKLSRLPSYVKFMKSVREAFISLNYLY